MAGYRRVKQVFVSSASLAAILIFTVLSFFFSPAPAHANPGDIDPDFGDGGSVALGDIYPLDILTESDGDLLVAGVEVRLRSNRPPLYTTVIQRYSPDGAADTAYAVRLPNVFMTATALQADGRLLLAADTINPSTADFEALTLIRLNADGTPDVSFGTDGRVILPFMQAQFNNIVALAVQADGKIVINGRANTRMAIVRLNTDGSLDTDYGRYGRFTTRLVLGFNQPGGLFLQPDGGLVMGAIINDILNNVNTLGFIRVTPQGTLDTSFADGGRFILNVASIPGQSACSLNNLGGFVQQPDGKLLGVASAFCNDRGLFTIRRLLVIRINNDGSLDTSYGSEGVALFNQVISFNDLKVDSMSRLLLAGSHGSQMVLARLTPNGALDAEFGPDGLRIYPFDPLSGSRTHTAIALQADDRIIAARILYRPQGTAPWQGALSRYLIGDAPPVTVPPFPFALLSPFDNTRYEGGFGSRLTFAWQFAEQAATYTLEVYKISDNVRLGLTFSKTVDSTTNFIQLNREEMALFTPGTYAWTVTASNAAGSTQADGRVFSINASSEELGLIFNGGFEQQLAGWQLRGPGQGDRVVCNSSERRVSFAGACAYRMTGRTGENSRVVQAFSISGVIEPGDRLILSAVLRNVSAQADRPVVMLVLTYFEGGRERVMLRLPAAGGEYTRLSAPVVLSGTLAAVRLEVRDANTNGVFFVDDVRLVLEPDLDALRSTADGLIPLPAAPDAPTLRGGE